MLVDLCPVCVVFLYKQACFSSVYSYVIGAGENTLDSARDVTCAAGYTGSPNSIACEALGFYQLQTVANCPGGTSWIATFDECQAAASSLSLGSVTSTSTSDRPYGCYVFDNQYVYFAANGITSHSSSFRDSICKVSEWTITTGCTGRYP